MRLEISCQDRLGITQDILDILVEHKIDLRGIEIYESGKIYLHFPNMEFEDFKHLMPKIRRINGIEDVKTTLYMPGEREHYQLSAILQALPDPVFSFDIKGAVVTCNTAALSSLELSQEEVEGLELGELIDGVVVSNWLERSDIGSQTTKVKFIKQDYLADIVPVFVPDGTNGSILAGGVMMLKSEVRLEQQFNTFHTYEKSAFEQFTTSSMAMKKVIKAAQQISDLDASIVISGETGSGKKRLAQACHQNSRRANKAFLVLNCALLPETVLELELFGCADNVMGQTSAKVGLFESCDGGTLFLNEVSALPENIQLKLIHFLETGQFNRIGEHKLRTVSVRVICSTTEDLSELSDKGKFKQELYYQLNSLNITMPALRDRKADIIEIAEECIVENSAKLGKRTAKLNKSCVDFLLQYPWPGNVRQLKNTLFRVLSMSDSSEIVKDDLKLPSCAPSVTYIDENFDGTLDEEVKKFEKDVLRRLYPSYPSTRQLAKKLGLSHTAIANKLREYGINKSSTPL
ncbi:sigma 54-interacting transcriptional regulator [Alteromonas sp. 5E99-2]|uniref:sigma-54-dependent transcriptional regulator n=1 Tax=Alteromonas sp. 5E99-2 TaxID=2817683 RepID=UPI001A99E6F2|nr:sigma 54-interacting transcriptional regulator [Alteromonas sp. 5E99-2]MBO1255181.1 sigma 54-interacting transcriptional regulator [Alteromonas sp. 5E99-2]